VGDAENEAVWDARFAEKRELVNRLYWDERDGFYYDIDRRDHSPYRVMTVASYWAMTAEIATSEQAAAMVRYVLDPSTLGGDVPLLSLAVNDGDFSPQGRYWRGALWLPTTYAALKGLSAYGYQKEAHVAAKKVLDHMLRTYLDYEPHTIWECYSPTAAAPATNTKDKGRVRPDFCGWSALGPISIYIEYVLGFHTINAFTRTVEWAMPGDLGPCVGICNLRFGNVVTDIVAEDGVCRVSSRAPYTLRINGKAFAVAAGENRFAL
jgi:glycogen debranching enzyme